MNQFSFCRLIGFLGCFLLIGLLVVGGGAFGSFIDIPSIIIVLGVTFFLLLGTFRKDFLKFIPSSFAMILFEYKKPNPTFANIAKHGSRYAIAAGTIGTVTGLVNMLQNLDDPARIGGGMAVALLTFFYAIILSEVVFAFLYKAFSDGNELIEEKAKCEIKPMNLNYLILPVFFLLIVFLSFFLLLTTLSS